MKIDNERSIYRIWLQKMVFTLVFTTSIIVVLFLNIFDNPNSSFKKEYLIIVISAVFIALSAIRMLRNPYYFFFDDSTETLIFRYYPVGLFNSKKNSLQIPKKQFVKFEINEFFMGKEQKLVLYQLYRNKVAKYPPISLSAVNEGDRKKLFLALERYSRKK